MRTVTIEFTHHHGEQVPGDRLAVDADVARRLVRAGVARYTAPRRKKK